MPPSRPRASPRSRVSACDPHDVQIGHVSLLVPNLPRQVARRRWRRRGSQARALWRPRQRRRNLRPCGRAARATTRRPAPNPRRGDAVERRARSRCRSSISTPGRACGQRRFSAWHEEKVSGLDPSTLARHDREIESEQSAYNSQWISRTPSGFGRLQNYAAVAATLRGPAARRRERLALGGPAARPPRRRGISPRR